MPSGTSRSFYGDRIRVEGLTEFQRALREIDAALPRELRKANKAAAEVVADAARSRAESLGGVAEKAAPSIKAAAEQRYAKVSLGGAAFPFALGANFGALHDQVRTTAQRVVRGWNQFPETGGKGHDRFLYWAVSHKRDEFMHEYERLLDELSAQAFPDGSHTLEVL